MVPKWKPSWNSRTEKHECSSYTDDYPRKLPKDTSSEMDKEYRHYKKTAQRGVGRQDDRIAAWNLK